MLTSDLHRFSAAGMLDVAVAESAELESVMTILAEASAALVERGINQWASPPSPGLWNLIWEQIGLRQVYLARLPGKHEPAGTVRLTWRHDAVWPEEPDAAGYVHTLAIRPALRGRQLGVALLAWVAGRLRERPRRLMRLDCMASNQPLRQYYERLGFVGRGVTAIDGYELARYELDLQTAVPSIGDSQCC